MEESHLQRTPAGHNPSGLEGQDENLPEKQSVLQKVKAKARKIKNTLITKHNHDEDHEYDHLENEDEGKDEEMVEDPETHGAPTNLERPKDRYHSKVADPPVSGLTAKDEVHHLSEDKHVSSSPIEKILHGQEESPGQERNKNGFPTAKEGIRGSDGKNIIGQEQNLGGQTGSHVQAKATDSNGSEEAAGITPIVSSFNKMGMNDDAEQKPEPLRDEYPDSLPKSYDPNNPKDLPRDTSGNPSSQTSTYTERLVSAASSFSDAAKSAKNLVDSKLGYSGNKSTGAPRQEVQGQGDTTKPASETDYAHKIAATGTEVEGSGTGTDNEGQNKGGASVKEYSAEKLKPAEEDKALSETITGSFNEQKSDIEQKTEAGEEVSTEGGRGVSEVTSDAFHKKESEGSGDRKSIGKVTESEVASDAFHKKESEGSGDRKPIGKVTESEVAAKRLGTGGEDEVEEVAGQSEIEQKTKAGEEVSTEGGRGVSEVTSDAFHDKESEGSGDRKPIGKVTESEVAAKRLGTGGEDEVEEVAGQSEIEQKTKAGEELSTEGGRGVSDETSDAFHKREAEVSGDSKPLEKVTESDEVAKRLGSGGEEEVAGRLGTGGEEGVGGKGVVDRIKGMVGSYWPGGKGVDAQTTPGTTYAGDGDHGQKAASE